MFKKLLVEPLLKPLSKKTPAWMAPVWGVLFFIVDRKVDASEAINAAQAAGDAAVKNNPAEGVVPTATDL